LVSHELVSRRATGCATKATAMSGAKIDLLTQYISAPSFLAGVVLSLRV